MRSFRHLWVRRGSKTLPIPLKIVYHKAVPDQVNPSHFSWINPFSRLLRSNFSLGYDGAQNQLVKIGC